MTDAKEASLSASHALLAAALGGLLCAAAVACTSAASSSAVPVSGDRPVPSTECDGGVSSSPMITSSMVIETMTEAQFTSQCAAENGIFEIQPHCGGSNSCRGMSYDTGTQTLIQHSCRALNSCAGYSCVVCD